jgi:Ca2+-binding EF-hand superfamily protein
VDQSGELTAKEWGLGLYRIELESWPEYDDDSVRHVVDIISDAAGKWHRARGNWYKLFRMVDTDNSGQMGFEELKAMCYRPLPCLAIHSRILKEVDLKGLWKALDKDKSSLVNTNEFMVFMRKHGTSNLVSSPREKFGIRPRLIGLNSRAEMRASESRADGVGNLSAEHLRSICAALNKQTEKTVADTYKTWNRDFDGIVSEWDFSAVFRKLLNIKEDQVDDDAVYTVWRFLDRENSGEVTIQQFLALGEDLQNGMKGTSSGNAGSEGYA